MIQLEIRETYQINGLAQDCSNTIADELYFLQACSKPL